MKCEPNGVEALNGIDDDPLLPTSLESLQSDGQRLVLDTVAEIRRCGLESVLALPQLVVCGDQSAGKSSVLEALTEIPFPCKDELCTRFATEIIMRRSSAEKITVKVIPDSSRSAHEKQSIEDFKESITDFTQLPQIIEKAKAVMGISTSGSSRAFARDVLSIEIEGPTRPQLTVVDLPGLIQNETKGVSKSDVELVRDITQQYISQPRTICLAVVSATNDYANQAILTKVREVDPEGERTLGIITKPDRVPAGSGAENAYIKLARNEDVSFKLGWHVVKNRSYEEANSSFQERNASEAAFFRKSNFNCLPEGIVGIDALRERLSNLLFEHVKLELPKLNADLNEALQDAEYELSKLGSSRASAEDCKHYLNQLSLEFHKVCAAAAGGHYNGDYFKYDTKEKFLPTSRSAIRRLRAIIQLVNSEFAKKVQEVGHTYEISQSGHPKTVRIDSEKDIPEPSYRPVALSRTEALCWVKRVQVRNHGHELPGDFNPLIIGELFWQQSARWSDLASCHLEEVAEICSRFLEDLLNDMCPKDIVSRLWAGHFEDALKARRGAGSREIDRIVEDFKGHPINYNHSYTEIIEKRSSAREVKSRENSPATPKKRRPLSDSDDGITPVRNNGDNVSNLDLFSCEGALDRLEAIYQVSLQTFIANITAQVIERHTVPGIENIFSPIFVGKLRLEELEEFASEPSASKRKRAFFTERIEKLKNGRVILRRAMRTTT